MDNKSIPVKKEKSKPNVLSYTWKGIYTVIKYCFLYPSFYLYRGLNGVKNILFPKKKIDLNNAIPLQKQDSVIDKNIEKTKPTGKEDNYYINKEVKPVKKKFSEKLNEVLETRLEKSRMKKNQISKVKRAQKLIEQTKLMNDEDDQRTEKKRTWYYEAISPEGKKVTGYFDAFTKSDIMGFLVSEDLVVYKLKTSKFIQALYGQSGKARKIKNKHLIFIIAQLSTYLKSGIPLADAIGIIVKQTKNKRRKRIFRNLRYELLLGESLSSAMEHQGNAFPSILINMVKSSELTGELPEVLDDMENYFTEIEQTRKQMISALTYPTLVLVFTIGVIIFVMIYVVPKFIQIYETMEEAKIPAFTQTIINISVFLEKYILIILLIFIAILLIILWLYKKVKVARTAMQYLAMKFPIIGNIIIYNEVAIFSKTFSSLLKHNVFITDSMDILNRVTNNEIYHEMILETITNLSKGDKISAAFKNKWAFPIPAYEMIVTGEKTGQLAEMMEKVSVYYQELHRNMVSRIKALIEPIIIILLTFGVGAVLLAVVIPMFSMYDAVQSMEG